MDTRPRRDRERPWEAEFAFGSDDELTAWSDAGLGRARSTRGPVPSPEPTVGVRIAHVLASPEGIEDIEVSVVCPGCNTKVLLDVAHEAAMQTAFSLLTRGSDGADGAARGASSEAGPDAEERAPDSTWRARAGAIREELSMLLMSFPVSEVMQAHTSSVRANARISSLSGLFAGDELSGIIVVDDDERPVGMITPAQIVRVTCAVSRERFEGLFVRNVMLSRMFCVLADAPLARAMELFNEQGARKIAVVGEDGKLVGSLSPPDLLHFLAS
jgi:CBS domain-containing protein